MNTPESFQSKNKFSLNPFLRSWERLDEPQKSILTKIWKVITYKWQLQILLNTPFLIYWLLDKNVESIHEFNMDIISKLNIPDWIVNMMGFTS